MPVILPGGAPGPGSPRAGYDARVRPRSPVITIDELERIAALGWRGSDFQPLGEWQLRAANGFTGRANSCLPLGSPGVPVMEALDRVRDFYTQRDLTPRIQLAEPLDPLGHPVALAADLAADGWVCGDPVFVLTAPVPNLIGFAGSSDDSISVRLAGHPDADWVQGYRYRGGVVPAAGSAVLAHADRPVFATVSDGAGRLAVARGVVDEGWLGITAVTVEERARRRGLATMLLGTLARWAAEQSAQHAYLQVDGANAPALALYRARGFTDHHRYRYWTTSSG